MQRDCSHSALFALALASAGCASAGPPGGSPPPLHESVNAESVAEDAQPERPGALQASLITSVAIADALGVHDHLLSLANNACNVHMTCRIERDQDRTTIGDCELYLADAWCPPGVCTEPFLSEPRIDDPCIQNIRQRTCDDLERPIECEALRDAGFEFRITDWPQGPVPPEKDFFSIMRELTDKRARE